MNLSWTPPISALRKTDFPRFHQILEKHGRGDLSFKIDSCCIPGIRLDCEQKGEHSGTIPVRCNRRICPSCARRDMAERIDRFHNIVYRTVPTTETQEKLGYELRFWTFTETAVPGRSLQKPAQAIVKSLHSWWRFMYGDKSTPLGGPYADVGGLFCIEVGEGWNIHAHALIYGPYHGVPGKSSRGSTAQLSTAREIWIHSLERSRWTGNRIHVEQVSDPEGSIVELISYPLNPEKRENLDERLLAHIELAFSGRNEKPCFPGIPGIRRYIAKGSWYNEFHPKHHPIFCPDCLKDRQYNWMIREPTYDSFRGRHFKPGHFDSQDRWDERLKYQNPEALNELEKSKKAYP